MSDGGTLHPLLIVLFAIMGSLAVTAVGCAIHRVLSPEEFTRPRFKAFTQEQLEVMREVCVRTRAEAFADSGAGQHQGRVYNGGYNSEQNDGYRGRHSDYSRV